MNYFSNSNPTLSTIPNNVYNKHYNCRQNNVTTVWKIGTSATFAVLIDNKY